MSNRFKAVGLAIVCAVTLAGYGTDALVAKPATPLLGFSTWNCFATDISEDQLRDVADAMVEKGLVAAGYRYLNIDDAWGEHDRDAHGNIVESKTKFPSGMKNFSEYLSARNMSLGLYTARNVRTCTGLMPGSLGNEARDAQTFANMGATFLKNDDCGVIYANAAEDYGAMQKGIASIPDVAMVHSVKAPDLSAEDAPNVCQYRRVGKDLKDDFYDVLRLLDTANDERYLSKVQQGFFSDLDMLETGNPGNSKENFPGELLTLNAAEQVSHYSLWAAFKSPLVIGADPRKLSDQDVALLTNPEILAVSQDSLATPVRLVSSFPSLRPNITANPGGVKLKMSKCSGHISQNFTISKIADGIVQLKATSGAGCATVLADRWPWWVSLMPCNISAPGQLWTTSVSSENPNALFWRSHFPGTPWPSGGKNGKCVNGTCPVASCLEVEGANPEVDQCNWSTTPSQFMWKWQGNSSEGQMINAMSGQCLAAADSLEIYAGPLSGKRFVGVLFNRRSTPSYMDFDLTTLGLHPDQQVSIRDIVTRKTLGSFKGTFSAEVESHGVLFVVVTPLQIDM